MRICHVITRLIVGGAQENTILTCKGLAAKGHEVTLLAGTETGPEGSLWDDAENSGCRIVRLKAMQRAIAPMQDWRAVLELQRHFHKLQPDIVHTHSSKAGIVGRAAAARSKVPFVVHTIHGMSFNRTQPRAIRVLYRALERWAAKRTHAFISVADAMTRQAVQAGVAPANRFVTIRSGMDVERFTPDAKRRRKMRHSWDFDDVHVVAGTVARLFENKGYEQILAAMPLALAKQPNLRFVWVGDGANWTLYESKLNELGLRDRVVFTGLLPPHQIPDVLQGVDVVLHASLWEGLPRALVQGLLLEIPGISFDIDGAPEIIASGETGLLVPEGDSQALAEALISLAEDKNRRIQMGQLGRQRTLPMFCQQAMVNQIEQLYRKRTHWVELGST